MRGDGTVGTDGISEYDDDYGDDDDDDGDGDTTIGELLPTAVVDSRGREGGDGLLQVMGGALAVSFAETTEASPRERVDRGRFLPIGQKSSS